ncbi:MotE family protein [Paenibacillus tritici]|uniref:MotE family protein n=1 Tax=Paenibacillus tritici TaxID=1873425 RepID=UPI001FE9D962|nr:kinesin [Paenibacillus tritici]
MANNQMELEDEGSAGKLERFLFLMIPIIFTLVLLGVLLTLFNMDIRQNVLAIANKIPIVEKWVPDPPPDPAAPGEAAENPPAESKEQAASSESTIKELKAQLTEQGEKLKKAEEDKAAETTKAEALQKQIDGLKSAAATAAATEEEEDPYLKKVKDLAKLYAGMKASKAAPIMENLTTDEMVQIFSVMSNASKSAILEKMDAKKAADVSIKLKETTNSTDMAIAALQSRLKQEAGTTPPKPSANLDQEKLSQTFTSMPAADAAVLLGSMYSLSPDKVITVLNSVSDTVRSSILGEMTKKDSKQTAKIVNRLMGGK